MDNAIPAESESGVLDQVDYQERRSGAIEFLRGHGAATMPHLNGFLLDHLERTEQLLREWGAGADLALAALCHAVYGTDGFAPHLVPVDDRGLVLSRVGPEVESIVYRYASCDRRFTYPRISSGEEPRFKDRYTGQLSTPTSAQLQDFVDLTLANECDVGVIGSSAVVAPPWLEDLFRQLQGAASVGVRRGVAEVLGVG